MQLKGFDTSKDQYVWVCPVFNENYKKEGLACSTACYTECCNQAQSGRIDRKMTPQIDEEYPQHLTSFKKIYKERTSIERVFAQLKEGLSMRRVHKRGKKAVEAQYGSLHHDSEYARLCFRVANGQTL